MGYGVPAFAPQNGGWASWMSPGGVNPALDLSVAGPSFAGVGPPMGGGADFSSMSGLSGLTGMTNGGGGMTSGLGMNMGTAQLALGGLQTLGNLWSSFQAQKLAKRAFNFQKGIANTNLDNSIKSYNTALGDKIGSRAFVQGMSSDQARAYVDANKLNRSGFKGG